MLFKWGVFAPPSDIWQLIVEYVGFVKSCREKLEQAQDIVKTIHTNCLSISAFKTMNNLLKRSSVAPDVRRFYTNLHIKQPDEDRRGIVLNAISHYYRDCRFQNITAFLQAQQRLQENVINDIINAEQENDDEDIPEGIQEEIQWVPETP